MTDSRRELNRESRNRRGEASLRLVAADFVAGGARVSVLGDQPMSGW